MNDCHGTDTKKANCRYEVRNVITKAFVHAYLGDTECKRTMSSRLWIITNRDVGAGEEITASYDPNYWKMVEDFGIESVATQTSVSLPGEAKRQRTTRANQPDHRPKDPQQQAMPRTRSRATTALSAIAVQEFSAQLVEEAFRVFDKEKDDRGHVVVMKLKNAGNLKEGCESLFKTEHMFMSHTNSGITFQQMDKAAGTCCLRVEHGLHLDKKRTRTMKMFAEPPSTLVKTHFAGTTFQAAWETVAGMIKQIWPRRQPLQMLFVTGDCHRLTQTLSLGNVTFSAQGQLVKCHYDGYHVVCFTVHGQKDFRCAKHKEIQAQLGSRNINEAHHVSAVDSTFASKFQTAGIPAGHVLMMEFNTWHEVCVETPGYC